MAEKLRVIVTGATGMVGEGVLHECLNHPDVVEVLSVSRRAPNITHSKLKTLVKTEFKNWDALAEQFKNYNACFFCLGVSSVGLKEPEFTEKTYDLTMDFAKAVASVSPELCFCYISGAHTDSTEKGKVMWARVKGRTENRLMDLFPSSYMFRPGYMNPTPGLKNALKYYKYITWMYPMLRKFFPSFVTTLAELGRAMINSARLGYDKKVIEVKDIVILAGKK